jgi:hypothetical protein
MARIVLAGATAAVCPIREQDQSNLGFVVISRFLVKNYSIAATTSTPHGFRRMVVICECSSRAAGTNAWWKL